MPAEKPIKRIQLYRGRRGLQGRITSFNGVTRAWETAHEKGKAKRSITFVQRAYRILTSIAYSLPYKIFKK